MTKFRNIQLEKLFAGVAIIESFPEYAYVFNKEGKLLLWNKHLETKLGYTRDELYLKGVYDFMEESVKDENVEAIKKIFGDKEEQTLEQNILTKSGKKIPVLDTANYAFINGEEYLVGIAIDISKRKKTETKLKAQILKTNHLKNLLSAENIFLQKELISNDEFSDFIGNSQALIKTLIQIKQVAPTDTAVLIEGETGTRKSLYARTIFKRSKRQQSPYIGINCLALDKDNFEKEFYDSLKEIFTEVDRSEKGKFLIINHGTLFIEEIQEMPLSFQFKFHKFLQEGKITTKGCTQVIHFDVRLITSTNQNLQELVSKNKFSKNLYYQINTFPIKLQPLRERITDLPLLIEKHLFRFNQKFGKKITRIPKNSMAILKEYSWPGNTRELENVIERAVILSNTSLLKIEPLKKENKNKIVSLQDHERQYIIKILDLTFWRIAGDKGAAKILGLHSETLRSKMRKLNIKKL